MALSGLVVKIPSAKKFLTIGFILIFVGGFILTLANSNVGLRGPPGPKGNSNFGEPPIYPRSSQEFSSICNVSLKSRRALHNVKDAEESTLIYFVTPTYTRREQVAELTRLGQTLMNVPHLHWIISEDSETCSPMVESLLQRFGFPYTHIISPMPKMYNAKTVRYKPRGVSSRRAAMQWVLKNRREEEKSILYFGDDDNTYDLQIFDEIRKTKKVSVFPVGFIGGQSLSSPLVETRRHVDGRILEQKVIGFTDDWFASRKFPVDMAGFAVDVGFLATHPNASMPYKAGYEEDYFLQSLNVTFDDLEPLAEGCSKILVWHTQTEKKKVPLVKPVKSTTSADGSTFPMIDTNLHRLVSELSVQGAIKLSPSGHELQVCKQLKGCD